MNRVIIAGGRGFNDRSRLYKTMNSLTQALDGQIEVVSGTARGADQIGEAWAAARGYDITRFPAEWDKYGKCAGYLRNKEMAQYATHAVIFWDGQSKGTKHMIDLAKAFELNYRVIRYE